MNNELNHELPALPDGYKHFSFEMPPHLIWMRHIKDGEPYGPPFLAHKPSEIGTTYYENSDPSRSYSYANGGVMPPSAPNFTLAPERHVGTFRLTWRHYAFVWAVLASLGEAVLIAYARMPR